VCNVEVKAWISVCIRKYQQWAQKIQQHFLEKLKSVHGIRHVTVVATTVIWEGPRDKQLRYFLRALFTTSFAGARSSWFFLPLRIKPSRNTKQTAERAFAVLGMLWKTLQRSDNRLCFLHVDGNTRDRVLCCGGYMVCCMCENLKNIVGTWCVTVCEPALPTKDGVNSVLTTDALACNGNLPRWQWWLWWQTLMTNSSQNQPSKGVWFCEEFLTYLKSCWTFYRYMIGTLLY
jgi:hypothetical protein